MKSLQAKPSPSMNSRSKKSSKEREKRKSTTSTSENNHVSSNEKAKQDSEKEYAGISIDSLRIYAEQVTDENLSEEVCQTLTEDINYKLRYIIHDALLKSRISGKNSIDAKTIDQTLADLQIEKIYGATATPNWIPFGEQNLLYLDDTKINLMELTEEENSYTLYKDVVVKAKWYPLLNEPSKAIKTYFTTMCEAVVNTDQEIREFALKDISENPNVGPIMEWFYHFGYFLLSKDITYDKLTLNALDLIRTLENCPLGSMTVSNLQLQLLVRLILQRLLKCVTTEEVLNPMCTVLALLCLRKSLRDLVILKINQKFASICDDFCLPILTIINHLGIEGVHKIFLPNMVYFLTRINQENDPILIYPILGIYSLLCKSNYDDTSVHNCFHNVFGTKLVMFWKPKSLTSPPVLREEINFVAIKKGLIRTRRKIEWCKNKDLKIVPLEEVFDVPFHACKLKRKIDDFRLKHKINDTKDTHFTVGRTTLLLDLIKNSKKKVIRECKDHSLLSYNI